MLAPVMLHRNATGGQAFTTPDEHYVVVVDKTGDSVHVVVPGEPGAASSMDLPSVDAMGGNPDKVAFFELPDGSWRMFVSLTDNFHSLVDETAEGDSGVGWVDLDAVYDNPDEAQNLTKVPGAGAVTTRAKRSAVQSMVGQQAVTVRGRAGPRWAARDLARTLSYVYCGSISR